MATQSIAPLVVIVGPTASGKTALALELAEKWNGEIICADSRAVYEGMDIGTAKPTREERDRVPHWGLDLVRPGERFTAADFKRYATTAITDIRARGHLPFLVGGTGLYIDGVLFDYQFGPGYDADRRAKLELLSVEELHRYCREYNIALPENMQNRRHVIRAIEQENVNTKRRDEPIDNTIVVGIATDRNELRTRIAHRAEQLFADGVVEEAIILGKKYGWDSEAMTGNIYPLVRMYVDGTFSLEYVKERFATLDWRLAKRQMTWLRRNSFITWLPLDEAQQFIDERLAGE